jgi:tripartite-type tricarboxylate transporter receptor subunit TctC
VDVAFGTTVSAVPYGQKGDLKLLATTNPKRLPALPDLPAMSEFAPGFEYVSFFGVVGPAGMPKPVVAALNRTINEVLVTPDLKKRLESDGSLIERTTPEGFQKTLESFVTRVQKLVRDAKLDLSEAGG